MNSTDNDELDAMLGALFDEVLTPIANAMRARGEHPFPLKPDVSWLSYYVRRRRSTTTAADFTSARNCSSRSGSTSLPGFTLGLDASH